MKLVLIAALLCVSQLAEAQPTWISGPDRAYNCTHYLDAPSAWESPPRVKPGEAMKLVMRRDKVMKFTLSARARTKGSKVAYALENAPPGATLAGAKFTWKVAGSPGEKLDFALVATENDRSTKWPITVTIADDKLVTAWSAGLGSVWPDCTVYAPMTYDDVRDLDGDGKDDVIYRTYAGGDGTTETHVMLQRGKLKFVEAHSCVGCGPESDIASDGTHLLLIQDSCCCIESGSVFRFDGDTVVSVASWQEPSPGSCNANPGTGVTISFDRDAKQRIKAIVMTDERGKVRTLRWKAKQFQP